MKPNIDALLRYPIFADFRPDEMASIAKVLDVVQLHAGEVLFEYQGSGSSMYFLDVGRIQIDQPTTPGNFQVLATLDPPSVFGEMALLTREPRSARALAIRPSVLWELRQRDLEPLAAEKHAAAFKIMQWIATEMSSRLRKTNEKLREMYAKPYKSIQELKRQIGHMTPASEVADRLLIPDDEIDISGEFKLDR